jgi:hypothetical protein
MWLFGRTKDEDEAENAGYRARQLYQILLQDYRPTVPTDAPLDDNEFCYSEAELTVATWQDFGRVSHWVGHRPVQAVLTNSRIFLRYLDGDGAWAFFWHGQIAHLTVDLYRWTLMLSYENGAGFRLDGPDVRACALVAARVRCGPSIMQEPWFTVLAA